jgi:ABC-type transport system involved in multi-copper enzyme maturation permease subunit
MNSLAYQSFILKNHRGFAVFSIVMATILQYVIIGLMTTFDTASMYNTLMSQMPERFRMMIAENYFVQMSIKGAAAFGFNHPIVLALIVINAIAVPARHITSEIEGGTMEWLLAYPVKRASLVLSMWASGCLLLLMIIIGALIGLYSALAVTHTFTLIIFTKMLQVGFNLWLLAIVIMSITFVIASFGRAGSKTHALSAAVVLSLYFLYFLATIWDSFAFMKPFSIFSYYQPQKVMFDQADFALDAGVLLGLTAVCLAASIWQFRRRDIPG